jgi:hypothetical protein
MKRVVLVFGIISGFISAALMSLTVPFMHTGAIPEKYGYAIGYTAIVLSFLLVFFGIRRYRENAGGTVSFGRAFTVGILITLISCVFYVVSWEVIYFNFMPDFMDKYTARSIEKLRQEGASPATIAEKQKQMDQMKTMYRNPLINAAMTFMEPFPVGLLVTLISAAVLRRRSAPLATALA